MSKKGEQISNSITKMVDSVEKHKKHHHHSKEAVPAVADTASKAAHKSATVIAMETVTDAAKNEAKKMAEYEALKVKKTENSEKKTDDAEENLV